MRCHPPEGPGPEAMAAFARVMERGLHERYPDCHFIVRPLEQVDDERDDEPDDD